MFISPKQVIENKWITHPECKTFDDFVNKKFVSPNAIDFTLDHLFTIGLSPFIISETTKQMREGGHPVTPQTLSSEEFWRLPKHSVYDGMSDFYVDVPEGVACTLVVRSTFNRNGIFITSGIYDQGYKGHIGFTIHNRSGESFVAPGTRIAQIIFHKSDDTGIMYDGGYNHTKGTHWTEETQPTQTKSKSTRTKSKRTSNRSSAKKSTGSPQL